MSQTVGNSCCWLYHRATTWIISAFSIVVTGLTSLIISMIIAFSPLTASTFATCDYFSSDAVSSLTRVLPTDPGILSSLASRDTTSNAGNCTSWIKDKTAVECIQNVFAATKNNQKKMRAFFSATIPPTCATSPVIPPRPITEAAFERAIPTTKIHRLLKRKREGHVFTASGACGDNGYDDDDDYDNDDHFGFVIHNEEDPRPKKKSRLGSPSTTTASDQRFRKKRASTNTISDKKEDGEHNENAKKKPRKVIGRQKRKYERKWETMFELLLEFRQKHGDAAVPSTYIENDIQLGKWVSNQRAAHKRETLSDGRIEMLDSIGFAWKVQEEARQWMDFYRCLVTYKEENSGSTAVPRRYLADHKLGFWVNRQRSKFRKNQLSATQIDLLVSIGFTWDARVEWKEKTTRHWMDMYRKLVSYKEEHNGSTMVPCSNHNCNRQNNGRDLRQLGNWVKEQRRRLRADKLSKNRADLLLSIGVAKDARKERDTTHWMNMYQKLVRYKQTHDGSTRVPQRYDEDLPLGRWVSEQRKRCKKKELVKLLDEIGFVWNAKKNRFSVS